MSPDRAQSPGDARSGVIPQAWLRRAADVIDACASTVSPPPWSGYATGEQAELFCGPWHTAGYLDGSVMAWPSGVAEEFGGLPSSDDLRWIELMGPQLAAPLAAWLRLTADQNDHHGVALAAGHPALAVAEAVLGQCHRPSGMAPLRDAS